MMYKPFLLIFGGIVNVLAAGALFWLSVQALEEMQYILKDLWMTSAVFILFWGIVLGMFIVAVRFFTTRFRFVADVVVLRALLIAFGTTLILLVIIARIFWTADTFIGTPWIDDPQVLQLFVGAGIAALSVALLFLGRAYQHRKNTVAERAKNNTPLIERSFVQRVAIHTLCIVIVLAVGIYQASYYLPGERWDLQNDEFLQYSAAVGYVRTGNYVHWDFVQDAPRISATGQQVIYDRASVSTWQIAQSMKLFGETEWAARLPALAWYVALLVIIYGVAFHWARSYTSATAAALSFTFFNGVLMHAQMVRMYSPLLTLSLVIVIGFWYAYQFFIRGQWLYWMISSALTLGATYFAWLHHELVLLLFPGMILFVVYEWLRYGIIRGLVYAKTRSKVLAHSVLKNVSFSEIIAVEKRAQLFRTIALVGALVAAAIVWIANIATNSAIFTLGHLGIRRIVNTEYEYLAFMDFSLPLVIMMLYGVGVLFFLLSPRSTAKERYTSILSLTAILLLLLFVKRYKAYRYIQFLFPVVFAVLWFYWYRVQRAFTSAFRVDSTQKIHSKRGIVWASISFVLLFVPIGIAGLPSMQPVLMPIQPADATYMDHHGFHTSDVYSYIREHKNENEALFALAFRDFYWKNDPGLELHTITRTKGYTLAQLQTELGRLQGSGAWFVWENSKEKELQLDVKQFITQHGQMLTPCTSELRESGMQVFYIGERRIPCEGEKEGLAWYSGDWASDYPVIAHALGDVAGIAKTNSKEAFLQSVQQGDRLIEADFAITKDKRLVVKHDWNVQNENGKIVQRPQTHAEYMRSKIHENYTPLDAPDLVSLLADHPDVSIVVDAKGSDYARVLELLKYDILKRDHALFSQVILQVYHPEDLLAAQQFSPDARILFTLYRTTLTDEEVLAFVQKQRIQVVTISKERFSTEFSQKLNALGVRVYVHTINKKRDAIKLQERGAHGVYSDLLNASDLR